MRTCVRHSCPAGHRHQCFLAVPAATWSGRVAPFLVGCHSAATAGATAANELVELALCPAQKGHPD